MSTAAPPASSADAFVERLLALEDADQRRTLIATHTLPPEAVHDAVLRLVDEAERLMTIDPARMERVCLDTRLLADGSGDPYLGAMALMRYADALRQQGRYYEARDAYDIAAARFNRQGRPVETARTRIGWAFASAYLGEFAAALTAARKSRRVLLAHDQTLRVANLDQAIGSINSRYGRYRAALRSFASAQALYQSFGDEHRLLIAHAHANRGGLAFVPLGRYKEALRELAIARDTFQEMGATRDAAFLLHSIGEIQMDLGRYSAALRSFEAAKVAMLRLEMRHGIVFVALAASECYLRLNRPAEALTVLSEADEDFRLSADPLDVIAALSRRAVAHQLLDEYAAALAALDSAEQHVPASAAQHRAELAVQRATLLLPSGNAEAALSAARHAYELGHGAALRRLEAGALITEGLALLTLGSEAEAHRVAVRALRLAHALDSAAVSHRAYELLGQIAEAREQSGQAVAYYASAAEQLEREQRSVIFDFRASFAQGRDTAYERLAALHLAADRPTEALASAERAKSRALADAIAGYVELVPRRRLTGPLRKPARDLAVAREEYAATSARLTREEGSPQMSAEEHARTLARLADLEHRIADIMRQLQILGTPEEFADLYVPVPGASLPELPDGTALIEYFLCGNDLLRFRVDGTGVSGVSLTGVVPEIERLIRALFSNLDVTERAAPDQRAQLASQLHAVLGRLGARLLGGLEGLDAYHSLVIVPHGLLHYLPFHALRDGDRYLVERFTVSYAPSAALYGVCRRRADRQWRGPALVLAHSAGGRLPYVATEATAVGKVLRAPVYHEAAATRARLQAEGRTAGLIHIAAHGHFRADAPLFSSITLADGPLTTVDIYGLNLRAGLVSLSACQTGRGVLGGGDEFIGLARAFLYAGAGRLLVSQWRVDDVATADLMSHFYKELADGNGPASALRTAQRAYLSAEMPQNDRRHPFYWAGFQMIGDDQGLQWRPVRARKDGTAWPMASTTTGTAN